MKPGARLVQQQRRPSRRRAVLSAVLLLAGGFLGGNLWAHHHAGLQNALTAETHRAAGVRHVLTQELGGAVAREGQAGAVREVREVQAEQRQHQRGSEERDRWRQQEGAGEAGQEVILAAGEAGGQQELEGAEEHAAAAAQQGVTTEDEQQQQQGTEEQPVAVEEEAGGGQQQQEHQQQPGPASLDQYHVVTSDGGGMYTQWQMRAHYYWYKKVRAAAQHGAMGGFTRLLSAKEPDGLEREVPTVLVNPLPPDLERIAAGFLVLNRPYSFKQWVEKHLRLLPERYVLMLEPDHILVDAPPLWATPVRPVAYPFSYMNPKQYPHIIARFNSKNVSLDMIGPIGNSPVMIHREQLGAIVEPWLNISFQIKQDPEADKQWGWIEEMYGFAIAASQAPGGPIWHDLKPEFLVHPPWDSEIKGSNGLPAYILHYTYGFDFDEAGQFTPGKVGQWHWDKRDFMGRYPPRNFPLPPPNCTNKASIETIKRINEAAEALPDWDQHTA